MWKFFMGNINYLLFLFDAYSYTKSHWMLLPLCEVWENLGSNEGPIAEKLQHLQRRRRFQLNIGDNKTALTSVASAYVDLS